MFSNPRKAALRYFEIIENSDVLLALVIIIIIIFLVVCIVIFYYCFFPDGIPEHLKEDRKEELEEGKSMMDGDEDKKDADGMANDAANGNGTAVQM